MMLGGPRPFADVPRGEVLVQPDGRHRAEGHRHQADESRDVERPEPAEQPVDEERRGVEHEHGRDVGPTQLPVASRPLAG
jgi:hypothetical protein